MGTYGAPAATTGIWPWVDKCPPCRFSLCLVGAISHLRWWAHLPSACNGQVADCNLKHLSNSVHPGGCVPSSGHETRKTPATLAESHVWHGKGPTTSPCL